ncbi:MAG: DedA family protein [Planctomycetes bacterium]|nr:DedA family protein [Planctomycetota bacterium]
MDWFSFLEQLLGNGAFSYVAVFVVLVLCGIGLPIPEEMTFLVAGYIVKRVDGHLGLMIAVSLAGILAGDSLTYYLGRRYGQQLLSRWPFSKLITPKGLERSRSFFRKHGSKAIFICGCLAGVRAPTFFLSATMGYRYTKFLLWDAARAAITCPVSILFGYLFGEAAEKNLGPYKHYFLGAIALAAVLIIVYEVRKHRRENAE